MKCVFLFFFVLFCIGTVPVKGEEAFLWPVPGFYNISSGFGVRNSGQHKGIDIDSYGAGRSIASAEIKAAQKGVVYAVNTGCTHDYGKTQSCGCGGGYGNFVYILHEDGSMARYAHLRSVWVVSGQKVMRGDGIGTAGSTGSSIGFHLHFELRSQSGEPVNPMPKGENRHTYFGSSAPYSEAIRYIYTTDFVATMQNGVIIAESGGGDEETGMMIAQYSGKKLLALTMSREARAEVRTEAGADTAKVMRWKGMRPEEDPILLRW